MSVRNLMNVSKILNEKPTIPTSLKDLILDTLKDIDDYEDNEDDKAYMRGVSQTLYLLGYISQEERDIFREEAE